MASRPIARLDWVELTERTVGCNAPHCLALAECLFEQQPLCLDHADELLQRLVARELHPATARLLPPLWES